MGVRWVVAVAVTMLVGGAAAPSEATPLGLGPSGRALSLWEATESWPGDAQYDPRLEQTVRFWGTGRPAAEVFESLTAQTGVALGFSPPGDQNERICLNLYLNPKRTPTLRDVLVQLGWVLDCTWAVEGEGEQRRYVLLGSTMGSGVLKRLQSDSLQEAVARGREAMQAQEEGEQVAFAKLQEIGEALILSREEVIARYKGRDNLMLLALLDPAKRALAQFCLTLDQGQLQQNHGAEVKWQDLSAEQKAWVRAALEPGLRNTAEALRQGWLGPETMRMAGWSARDRWDDWGWVEREVLGDLEVTVQYGFLLSSRQGAEALEPVPGAPGALRRGAAKRPQLPAVWLLLHRDPRDDASGGQDVGGRLYELLGEPVPEEVDPEAGDRAEVREYKEARQRARLKAQLAGQCHLSAQAKAELAAVTLPAELSKPYALWQSQEATAARTGRHVISDHFWQPPRRAQPVLVALEPGKTQQPTALALLQAGTVATEGRTRLLYGPPEGGEQLTRWEWGDAGEFLRFRSVDRDVWRAAWLPAEAVATLDGWLKPHLPRNLGHAERVAVPLDPRETGRLLKGLNLLQWRWGGVLCAGDPTEALEQWRRGFRGTLFRALLERGRYYVLLSGLTGAQWQRAQAKGVRLAAGVMLPTDPLDRFDPAGSLLRIRPRQEPEGRALRKLFPGSEWSCLEFTQQSPPQEAPTRRFVATKMVVKPTRLGYLVAEPR